MTSKTKDLTQDEKRMVVLNTTMQKFEEGERFFIFDCNNGVLNSEFNEKLRNFFQDAIKNYDPKDKRIIKNLEAIQDLFHSLPEGKISTENMDRIMNMIMEIEV